MIAQCHTGDLRPCIAFEPLVEAPVPGSLVHLVEQGGGFRRAGVIRGYFLSEGIVLRDE